MPKNKQLFIKMINLTYSKVKMLISGRQYSRIRKRLKDHDEPSYLLRVQLIHYFFFKFDEKK